MKLLTTAITPHSFTPVTTTAPSNGPAHSLIARLGAGQRVEGGYRLLSLEPRRRSDGYAVWHARLADRSGVIDAYRPAEGVDLRTIVRANSLVFAEFRTRTHNGRLFADFDILDLLGGVPDPALAIDRLPRPLAHFPEALDHLVERVHGMGRSALRGCLERAFLADDLMLHWIGRTDDAFARSVGAATAVTHRIFPCYATRDARDLASVACLLRPMGSLPPLAGEDPWRDPLARNRAAGYALTRCGPALDWLAGIDPVAARRLRGLLGGRGDVRQDGLFRAVADAVCYSESRVGLDYRELFSDSRRDS
jgi:hypothetical protein